MNLAKTVDEALVAATLKVTGVVAVRAWRSGERRALRGVDHPIRTARSLPAAGPNEVGRVIRPAMADQGSVADVSEPAADLLARILDAGDQLFHPVGGEAV